MEENQMSYLDLLNQNQETYQDALDKQKRESYQNNTINFFKMSKDGTYTIRILPLFPELDKDGNIRPDTRKGYEYPSKDIIMKIKRPKVDANQEPYINVNVCHIQQAIPSVECDLIDKYVEVAKKMYGDNELLDGKKKITLSEKISQSTYSGGLKWNSNRNMYVVDKNDNKEEIQRLSLSYSQYKDLESAKLKTWEKTGGDVCPISSLGEVFWVEIDRKTGNNKNSPEYKISVDAFSRKAPALTEDLITRLAELPRLPEVLYRYSRYHLEATIEFLTQKDKAFGIDVMGTKEIKECIEQIKLSLSADDKSHFSFDKKDNKKGQNGDGQADFQGILDMYDKLCEADLDDYSDEGRGLRAKIKEFIEEKNIDMRVSKKSTLEELIDELSEIMRKRGKNSKEEDGDDEDSDEDEEEKEPSVNRDSHREDDEEEKERPSRRERTEDSEESRPRRRR